MLFGFLFSYSGTIIDTVTKIRNPELDSVPLISDMVCRLAPKASNMGIMNLRQEKAVNSGPSGYGTMDRKPSGSN